VDRSWVLASSNVGKLLEFKRLLASHQIHLRTQHELNVAPCDEPFDTFLENSLHKARHASRETGLPALADDSGLCLPVLGGAPGVYSARFAARQSFACSGVTDTDRLNNLALVHALQQSGQPESNWAGFYACVLVFVRHANDPMPLIAQATWWGRLQTQAQGNAGFGYDAHFYIAQTQCTVAQLTPEMKNQLSHRGQAMRQLALQLEQWPA
jgi:XTP/dITP diphosphohydrolase